MKRNNYACTVVFVAFIAIFALLIVVLPRTDYSENEKRVLAKFPELSPESIADGEFTAGLEDYLNDHFPFRNTFVGIYAYYNQLIGRGNASGIYRLTDGSLVAAPAQIDWNKCDRNMARLDAFADSVSLPATLILVPSAGYANRDKLPFGHAEYGDDGIYASAQSNLRSVQLIDLRTLFREKEMAGETVYFNTDHHITSYGSYLAYLEFCKRNSIPPTEGDHEIETIENFYGTNYSKSGLWLTEPDTLEIWHSPNKYSFTVTINDITEQTTQNGLYFYSHAENMDKYPIFLDGNHAVTTIKNESVQNGKTLLVVKDSYAHCLSTFLCDQYETVCLVDLRYYRGSVSKIADEIHATELLYVFGAETVATLSELALLK